MNSPILRATESRKTTRNWLALKQKFSELTNPVKPAPLSSSLLELEKKKRKKKRKKEKKKKLFEKLSPWYNRTGWLGVKLQVAYFQKLIQQELYTVFQGTTRSCR